MKRSFRVILIAGAAYAFLAAGAGGLTRQVLVRQLTRLLGAESVKIASCSFWRPGVVRLRGVEIAASGLRITVGRVTAKYSPATVFTRTIPAVEVSHAAAKVTVAPRKLATVPLLNAGPGAVPLLKVKKVSLRSCRMDYASADLRCAGEVTADIALDTRRISALQMRISNCDRGQLRLREVILKADAGNSGILSAQEVSYGKLHLRGLRGKPYIRGADLICAPLEAEFLAGRLNGKLKVSLIPRPAYTLALRAFQLDLAVMVDEFELDEKMYLSGTLQGNVSARGALPAVSLLEGIFSAAAPGGMLVIRDQRFLETLADSAHQPVEVIAGSFQNYRYDTATLQLDTIDDQLVLKMNMDGVQGKREVTVVLHDFKSGGGR